MTPSYYSCSALALVAITDRDQMRIMGLQSQVASGTELISWHTSNEDEHCKFYSNADMAMIAEKAVSYVTAHHGLPQKAPVPRNLILIEQA